MQLRDDSRGLAAVFCLTVRASSCRNLMPDTRTGRQAYRVAQGLTKTLCRTSVIKFS